MKYKVKQLREMSDSQLAQTLQELQGELRHLRFLAGHGELKKIHKIQIINRSIARIHTLVSENSRNQHKSNKDLTKK